MREHICPTTSSTLIHDEVCMNSTYHDRPESHVVDVVDLGGGRFGNRLDNQHAPLASHDDDGIDVATFTTRHR